MSKALSLLCRVVKRRVESGEALDAVLAEYARLTESEKAEVREKIK